MSQDGIDVATMELNAAQYEGASVEVVEDAEYVERQGVQDSLLVRQVVTMRQARLALLQYGLLGTVQSVVDAMPWAEGDAARIEWEFSSTVERNRPLVQSLATALPLTEQQLDDLFRLAATL